MQCSMLFAWWKLLMAIDFNGLMCWKITSCTFLFCSMYTLETKTFVTMHYLYQLLSSLGLFPPTLCHISPLISSAALYCNFLRAPTLLPNKRSEEQKKAAYRMLRDCFHYSLNTSTCRAKILVKYFGEEFGPDRCDMCDVCINGPPQMHDFKEEAIVFMNVLQGRSVSIQCKSGDHLLF